MQTIMKLHGSASTGTTPHDGQYLKAFDFEAFSGRGEITMTPNAEEAMRFPYPRDALEFYERTPKCKPLREDGLPNRPLTASHWEFLSVEGDGDDFDKADQKHNAQMLDGCETEDEFNAELRRQSQ